MCSTWATCWNGLEGAPQTTASPASFLTPGSAACWTWWMQVGGHGAQPAHAWAQAPNPGDKRACQLTSPCKLTRLHMSDTRCVCNCCAGASAVISAPTSSGKTFLISYAIQSVLAQGKEGQLVIVLPTKALVNQLTAQVWAPVDCLGAGLALAL